MSTGDRIIVDRTAIGNVPNGLRESLKEATKRRLEAPEIKAKAFTEFFKITDKKDAESVVMALLGDEATLTTFWQQFGVNITDYLGFFVEVGNVDALQGALVRSVVSPIMVLRAGTEENKYIVTTFKMPGLISTDGKAAWVDQVAWENAIGV